MGTSNPTWGNRGKKHYVSWSESGRKPLSLIPYTGGKAGLIKEIVPLVEWCAREHDLNRYIEATGGGGRMLLNIDPNLFSDRMYNDMNYAVCALFAVLTNQFKTEDLMKMLNTKDYKEKNFNQAIQRMNRDNHLFDQGREEEVSNLVQAAANAYLTAHQSFRGNMKTYARSVEWQDRPKMGRYYKKVLNLEGVVPRLEGVEVTRKDCRELIKAYSDHRDCFIYLDPPYDPEAMKGKEHYKYSWTTEDHVNFVELVKDTNTFMAISAYESRAYEKLVSDYGWKKVFLKEKHVASSGRGRKKEEFLYINFDIPSSLQEVYPVNGSSIRSNRGRSIL